MVKAIKAMLIPNNVQKTKMFQYAGASRFAYNWALAREIENYKKGGRFISDAELRKGFTELRHSDEYAWLLSISNNVTKQAIKDACTAYKNLFKGLQKYPRFKSKKKSTPKFYQDNIKTYLLAKGQPFEIISDIGSGINYKKKGLQELIRRISQDQVEKVVVLYKDRLLRFGFELIEYIASLYNCEIEIIDNTEKSEQQELVEELVQIITVSSCKLQGKRANKAKKLIRELIQEEVDGKSHKSNVDTKQCTEN